MKLKVELDTSGLGAWTARQLARRRVKAGLALALVATPLALVAAVVKPNTFSDGQLISASEINANFDAIFDLVNAPTFTAEFARNNYKQCTFAPGNEDGTDNGATIFQCSYDKKMDSSALKLTWSGTLRSAYNCNACCSMWTLRVDGQECTVPGRIDAVTYTHMLQGQTTDLHHNRSFTGICTTTSAGAIKAGTHNIRLYIQPCSGYNATDGYSGWNATSRILIEELP